MEYLWNYIFDERKVMKKKNPLGGGSFFYIHEIRLSADTLSTSGSRQYITPHNSAQATSCVKNYVYEVAHG